MKPYYKKPPPPFNMKPQPDLDSLIADHLAKFETEKPTLKHCMRMKLEALRCDWTPSLTQALL